MLKKLLAPLFFIAISANIFAQVGQGGLKGKVIDAGTGEPLPFVNVVLEAGGSQKSGGSTDFNGEYFIKPLPAGKYDVKVKFIGYKPQVIQGVVVTGDGISFLEIGRAHV